MAHRGDARSIAGCACCRKVAKCAPQRRDDRRPEMVILQDNRFESRDTPMLNGCSHGVEFSRQLMFSMIPRNKARRKISTDASE